MIDESAWKQIENAMVKGKISNDHVCSRHDERPEHLLKCFKFEEISMETLTARYGYYNEGKWYYDVSNNSYRIDYVDHVLNNEVKTIFKPMAAAPLIIETEDAWYTIAPAVSTVVSEIVVAAILKEDKESYSQITGCKCPNYIPSKKLKLRRMMRKKAIKEVEG